MMADYKLGVSILKREDESLKDYLLSFSPFAPFFGVPYRFTAATGFDPFAFVPKPATAEPTPAPAPKARKPKAAQPVEDAVEAATAPAKAAAEVAATAAETTAEIVATAVDTAAETATEMTEAAADGAPALLYATAPAAADDLKQIKGIGPKLERELNGMGLYTFAQMASLTEANLEWVDQNLTAFRGRSVRDDWVGQASALLGS
ncbi:hypothetical protein P2H44_03280 [Albimonas sp. CAU 1670]|uniref:hypothetical protein n=1 Tax=Albimonas sp. CAU 1670 TaxID=3032599 RepID=UPI0023DCB6AE|nr:hypothetical protein [Albimonas sp. CAU 1670]MDF2231567.1 hypothetical protein [Albimonas sp. CAU 1670]